MSEENINIPADSESQAATDRFSRRTWQNRMQEFPASSPCPYHPHVELVLSREASGLYYPVYSDCPACQLERTQKRLRAAGVPANLLHATFDNWTPRDKTDMACLEAAKAFVRARRGFLFMLGNLGAGKSHLAVAVMRSFKCALFSTQAELLRQLRASYGDSEVPDPIGRSQGADLLVIDDVGLSGGGKDEFPMLSAILEHRHGERLPTIVTSNLDTAGLKALLGDRLADRLSESTFRVLQFAGQSHRPERRDAYFTDVVEQDNRNDTKPCI